MLQVGETKKNSQQEIPILRKSTELERLVVAKEWREGGIKSDCHSYRISFGRDKNILELDNGDGCTTLCIYMHKKEL